MKLVKRVIHLVKHSEASNESNTSSTASKENLTVKRDLLMNAKRLAKET